MPTPFWEVECNADGPKVVHVSTTAIGGGVAELLHGLLAWQRSAGTNAGWAVLQGTDDFFAVTKYLHHLLHGRGRPDRLHDPTLLGTYRQALASQAPWLTAQLGPGDVVILHDPQTLGLAPAMRTAGTRVVWHCHIGTRDRAAPGPAAVWRALSAELDAVDAVVTTLPEFAPVSPAAHRRFVVAPAVDPGSAKNRVLSRTEVASLLDDIGLTAVRTAPDVTITQCAPVPRDARVVLQVSRWDPLKDMPGVVRCAEGLPPDVHLVLAGTDPTEIPDDPEGLAVLTEVRRVWAGLRPADRERVHLVTISMRDPRRNSVLVNALQRRADVVLQKSLAEGFGLTATEAMVKGCAVVVSAVGGLRRQVVDGVNGLLVDPTDLEGVRTALTRLLNDPALRRALGARARADVLERYTMQRLVDDYAAVIAPDVAVTA